MAGWGTQDPIRGLKLSRLVSSRMVLIRKAGLGRCMMQAKWRDSAGVRPFSSGSRSKSHVLTMPPFFSAEGWCFFSRRKYGAFKPLVDKV